MPFALIDSKKSIRAMPSSSAEAARLLEESMDKIFHYEIDRRTHVIQGFSLASGTMTLLPLWNIELGVVGEQILASAAPEHREWDHVPVYIKGDASILFKYINKNLLAVMSQDHSQRGNVSSLNLYALDAVTGHVLHQSRIVGGSGPVKLVACDNWVMMHYWNAKKTRFEVTIVEFFQAKADDGPWNILFGSASATNQSKSAHYLESPVPLQQTYIFPAGVTSLGVTATLKGITPRSVIMALSTDHIFRVSKDLLNPRRPHPSGSIDKELNFPSQFAPTKEEAMPPYNAMLPLKPTDVLTHYNPMSRVVGIASSPTALESTSIVFCYGLDLYFAPVQTAKAYDVLRPGFNYTLLYASVGSVLACFIVTSYLARRKALYDRWK